MHHLVINGMVSLKGRISTDKEKTNHSKNNVPTLQTIVITEGRGGWNWKGMSKGSIFVVTVLFLVLLIVHFCG